MTKTKRTRKKKIREHYDTRGRRDNFMWKMDHMYNLNPNPLTIDKDRDKRKVKDKDEENEKEKDK